MNNSLNNWKCFKIRNIPLSKDIDNFPTEKFRTASKSYEQLTSLKKLYHGNILTISPTIRFNKLRNIQKQQNSENQTFEIATTDGNVWVWGTVTTGPALATSVPGRLLPSACKP